MQYKVIFQDFILSTGLVAWHGPTFLFYRTFVIHFILQSMRFGELRWDMKYLLHSIQRQMFVSTIVQRQI